MRKLICVVAIATLALVGCNSVPYKQAKEDWKTHQDVADWLDGNFRFDPSRQKEVLRTMKASGPSDVVLRSPEQVYESGGYCADSANFAYQNLRRLDTSYKPRFVFIENAKGRPHHWVTAFEHQEKIYVMDYGTGSKWSAMQGLHGPYNELSEYKAYLSSLNLPGFGVGSVYYREFPGKVTE